ncbi:MAG: MATE family efflux transporter [Lachnospiraceae bacterium]|nr:MATE family efflux transporter [Lachnospiraceae bacterium]
MKKELTSGSVLQTLFYFSLPYFLSYFLQTLYGMADLYIVGRFNAVESTTAVSVGSQIMHMITVMIVGLAMGTTVSIGHEAGAKNEKRMMEAIGNTATLFLGLSIAAAFVLTLCVHPIVRVMSVPAEAVNSAVFYLTICFIGIPFITAYNIISAVFRGMGDSKSPMYFITVACVSNIALDYLFIGAFGMGAAGAALGTTLSQAISVAVALYRIKTDSGMRHIRLTAQDFKPKGAVMGKLLSIGVPVAMQDGFIQISFLLITIIANKRGLFDAAAVGVVEKIIGILFLVPSSMLSAVSALAAQNIGAGKKDRARQTLWYAMFAAVIFGTVSALLMQFFAEPVVGIFRGEPEVVLLGGQYLRGYVWDCVFAGVHFCFSGYFCACGRSGLSFLHNAIAIVCARIPLVYLASKLFADTLFPMGLATVTGSAVSVVICVIAYLWLLRPDRKHRIMEE